MNNNELSLKEKYENWLNMNEFSKGWGNWE